MNSRTRGRERIARALREAAKEEGRAVHAAAVGERHGALMVNAPAGTQALHATMSKLHRQIETRHRTAAQMYRTYAARLEQQADSAASGDSDAPSFMTAVTNVAGAHAASVSLLGGASADIVLASDRTARTAQDLEFALGEGPARDSLADGPLCVSTPDLGHRWQSYGAGVETLGVRSVAAVPLRIDHVAVGSLVVFGTASCAIGANLDRLRHIGDAFVHILLADHRDSADQTMAALLTDELDHRPVVHQAAGMVSVQQGCSVADALALLRARAFAQDADIMTVAQQIVDSHLLISDG